MKLNRTALLLLALLVAQTVGATTITVTSTADSGAGTLRDALAGAANGDTIDATGVSGTILLTSGELLVNKSVSIIGIGPANLAVDGNAAGWHVFYIGSNTVVSISGLTITNGFASGDLDDVLAASGGGIYNDHATLTVSNCTLSVNYADDLNGGVGGGIFNAGGEGTVTVEIVNSTLSGNGALFGGGIYNGGGGDTATVRIANSTLSGGFANSGGGIYNGAGVVEIVNSTVRSNGAVSIGGGIFNGGTLTVSNSTFSGNGADGAGGIFNDYTGTFTVNNCTLNGNTAYFGGGGAIVNASTLTVNNSTLSGNTADFGGGGGIVNAGTLTVNNSTLSGNSAGYAGGIYNDGGTLIVESSTLNGNSGGVIAGAIANNYGTATVSSSTISGNSAELGGGIWTVGDVDGTPFTLRNSTISGNSGEDGGGIYWFGGKLTVENSTISGNSASDPSGGGGISDGGSGTLFTLNGSIVAMNTGSGAPDISGSFTGTFNFIGGDPMLGPLQDNGGPTFTHALLCGSPAIDQGKNFSASATDQRGAAFARTVDDPAVPNAAGGDGTDIGAFEVQQGGCALPDTDGDGVPDAIDQCPDTHPGAIVNATGCSIDQLVPCGGPRSGGKWKNHGQYVSAVTHEANKFLAAGLITGAQKGAIVAKAAQSNCGK